MNFSARIFAGDVELGKKDDDHKFHHEQGFLRSIWRRPLRYRKKRILLTLFGCTLLWLFMRTTPNNRAIVEPDTVPIRYPPYTSSEKRNSEPEGPPPAAPKANRKDKEDEENTNHYYDGPIKFYKLAKTLHSALTSMGYRTINRNVVLVASDLKSTSTMINMACEMATWDRNYVHMAVMGRDDISLDELLDINGVDRKKCNVFWHDARPDYTVYSSDKRAEYGVESALGHINSFLHPKVVIMDDPLNEDVFFTRAIQTKAETLTMTIIEIPKDASDKLMWITRLDSAALRSWHQASIDILIHAPPDGSGSLLRLLKSLQKADYDGVKPPRLIIELPAEVDPATQQFIDSFAWPPPSSSDVDHSFSNQLILHHRISSQRATPEQASIRFLESYYPSQPSNYHVLVLSSQAQVSPLFYHFLRQNVLEYHYSTFSSSDSLNLLGISLELPSVHLNGTTDFQLPTVQDMIAKRHVNAVGVISAPFLWDAPNSNAALYFGPKWIEMHSFLTHRLAAESESSKKPAKLISQALPAWTEYILEFMRARGYYLLYPGSTSRDTLVTVHNELPQHPEEYGPPTPKKVSNEALESSIDLPEDGVLYSDTFSNSKQPTPEFQIVQASRPLHEVMPFAGELPELNLLPHFSYSGDRLALTDALSLSEAYIAQFRKDIGRCEPEPEGVKRKVQEGSARDMFCFGDETEQDYEEEDIPYGRPVVLEPGFITASKIPSLGEGVKVDGVKSPLPRIPVAPKAANLAAIATSSLHSEATIQATPAPEI